MADIPGILRSLPLALIGSTSERTHKLLQWDTAIRAPITTSRHISFVQLRGGTGASTTAHYVGGLLAIRRTGLVLGVDAAGGGGGLGELGGNGNAPRRDRRDQPKTVADATKGMLRTLSGMYLLEIDAVQSGAVPRTAGWIRSVAPVARFFDAVCTDWGERSVGADLADVAALSHTVCLVARGDRQHAEEAVSVITAIEASAEKPAVVVALVDVGDSAGLGSAIVAGTCGATVVPVPFDRGWASFVPGQPVELATKTRLAYTRLAAALLAPSKRAVAGVEAR
jgi:MinD-like ATPase involved in chromosome partitioning or flagellar assembly